MTTLNGLPAHILLVHAIVVLLPLTAVLLVLCALWPAARRKLTGANALLAVIVVILIPITTEAGEWLERRVPSTPLLRDHTELGDTALWVAIPVAVLAVAIWWRHREESLVGRKFLAPASTAVTAILAALAVLAAGAAIYDIVRIGDSGAQATWQGKFSSTPAPRGR